MSMFLLFLAGALGWAVIRSQITPKEWQRRVFWAATIGTIALPSFTGLHNEPAVTGVLWPFVAGLMAGELAWNRYKPKWDGLQAKFQAPPPPPKKRRKKKPTDQPPQL